LVGRLARVVGRRCLLLWLWLGLLLLRLRFLLRVLRRVVVRRWLLLRLGWRVEGVGGFAGVGHGWDRR